jgi:hypothetical protein
MKSLIRKWLMGDTVFSEYSKITAPDDLQQKVWLRVNGDIKEVSANHWLLCIEPIIFGVWLEKDVTHNDYEIYFGGVVNKDKSKIDQPEAVLIMDLLDHVEESNGTLLILRLRKSQIYHIGFIKRYLLFLRYYKKGGLTFSRFKSFVSAYSYPRRIRIVSFRQNNYYNIFPMDLLGDISQYKRYVFGLRHTNVALPKIIESGKLVVAEVPYIYKDVIYQLGKHHSGSPPSVDSLPFKTIPSKNFAFPIPDWVESYKEISILKTINMGSHMLLWGELIDETQLTKPLEHLFLIHFLHYLHQKNKGLPYMPV